LENEHKGKMRKSRIVKVRDPWGKIKWQNFDKLGKDGKKLRAFQLWNKTIRQFESNLTHNQAQFWDDGCLYLLWEVFYENFSEITISHYSKIKILSQYKTHTSLNKTRYFELKFTLKQLKQHISDSDEDLDLTLTISHEDKRNPNYSLGTPFTNSKLIYVPHKRSNIQDGVLDFMSDAESQKYFDNFHQADHSK
jgi:hypothetical protein